MLIFKMKGIHLCAQRLDLFHALNSFVLGRWPRRLFHPMAMVASYSLMQEFSIMHALYNLAAS